MPLPNEVFCPVSKCVSSDNSFPSVRQESTLRHWKGFPFLQQQELKIYKLYFPHPLPADFSLESTMKAFVQNLDSRRKWETIILQGPQKAEAVTFRCQRQLILVDVVYLQFLYCPATFLKTSSGFSTGCVSLQFHLLNSIHFELWKILCFPNLTLTNQDPLGKNIEVIYHLITIITRFSSMTIIYIATALYAQLLT